ncbi:MAG: serine/threonine protein kinase, partial [Acidimicrobiales bacterium]
MSGSNENKGTDQRVGQLLGERYRLISPLGSGRSARVYLADDLLLGRPVAVKCFHRDLVADERVLEWFRSVAEAAGELSHPNLLAVHDSGDDNGPYLVTELLLGGTVRDIIERPMQLTPSQGLLVALQAAYALEYAHGAGWVHRDVKPANLLFGPDGRLRLADIGFAELVRAAPAVGNVAGPSASDRGPGRLGGRSSGFRYASPERIEGGALDARADLYSLVLTVVEAVTGKVPLLADSAAATMELRHHNDVDTISDLGALGEALEPAGRADPAHRPTVGELVERLTSAARTLPRPDRLPLAARDLDPSEQHYLDDDKNPGGHINRDDARVDDTDEVLAEPTIDLRGDGYSVELSEPDGPHRRSSDQVAYEPIPKPAFLTTEKPEPGRLGILEGDDEPLGLGEVTVIQRPSARLRPAHLPHSPDPPARTVEPTTPNGSGNGNGLENKLGGEKKPGGEKTPGGEDGAGRRSGRRPVTTSWLDEAKLDPNEVTSSSLTAAVVSPDHEDHVGDDESTSGVSSKRRREIVESSAPVSLSRVVDDRADAGQPAHELGEVPDVVVDPTRRSVLGGRTQSEPARSTSARRDADGFEPGSPPPPPPGRPGPDDAVASDPAPYDPAPYDSAFDDPAFDDPAFDDPAFEDSAFDDPAFEDEDPAVAAPETLPTEVVRSQVGQEASELPDDGPAETLSSESASSESALSESALSEPVNGGSVLEEPSFHGIEDDDVDVFVSAERSARPPEPGRLELPAPIGRTPAKNTELNSWFPPSLRDLGPNDPAARLAVAAVAGVVVTLAIAVIGLRVTGGAETEATTSSPDLQSTEGEAEATPVGSYVGRPVDAARADAAANDWELNTIRVWRNDTALGEVVEQAPLAGTPLEAGGRLDLVVSQGPELLPIPPVVGRNADEAIEMLGEAGLVVGTVTEVEGGAAPGEVIATAVQDAPPGTEVVESGSVVDLIVRARGDAKPMPSFVGLT